MPEQPPQVPSTFRPPTVLSTDGRIAEGGINGQDVSEFAQEVLTGLYIPGANDAVIAGGMATHGTLIEWYSREHTFSRVLGFKAVRVDGEVIFEIPGGGGGLFQGLSTLGLAESVQRIKGWSIDPPDYLYECIYAGRRFGIEEDALVRYTHDEPASVDPNYSVTDEYRLRDCYQELRFDGSLPPVYDETETTGPDPTDAAVAVLRDAIEDTGGFVARVSDTSRPTIDFSPDNRTTPEQRIGIASDGEFGSAFVVYPDETVTGTIRLGSLGMSEGDDLFLAKSRIADIAEESGPPGEVGIVGDGHDILVRMRDMAGMTADRLQTPGDDIPHVEINEQLDADAVAAWYRRFIPAYREAKPDIRDGVL